MTDDKNSHITTKTSKFHYRKKWREASAAARIATLSIRLNSTPFSNIDYLTISPTNASALKETFFNDKTPLPYNREHWLRKLILCQYVMQSEQTEKLKVIPFVIRFNHKDMALDSTQLKRKIRNTFKKALGVTPLYWLNFEHNVKGIRNKHCNGEVLISPELLPKLKSALEKLYGLNNDGVNNAIKFPVGSREKEAKKHGLFYAVYNWSGYGTKESNMLRIERDRLKNTDINKGHFYSMSSELNSKAKLLHKEIILI